MWIRARTDAVQWPVRIRKTWRSRTGTGKYLKHWVDEATCRIFCLAEAPNRDAAVRVHREAHGLVPDEIYEVKEGS